MNTFRFHAQHAQKKRVPRSTTLASAAIAVSIAAATTGSGGAQAASTAAKIAALRISGMVTDGAMPVNGAEFESMIGSIERGDYVSAAYTAARTRYFASGPARRLALQMMNPALDATAARDNDATLFLIAHFVGAKDGNGAAIAPAISKIWSDNVTCFVNIGGVNKHVFDDTNTAAQLSAINYANDIVCTPDQLVDNGTAKVVLPPKHVGGYLTLSHRGNDLSFAQAGATAGTNLRMIANFWTIATGMQVPDFATVAGARSQNVPKFIPQRDPNFILGQNQAACISCHGGGLVSISKGYATVADIFDFDANRGLRYFATPGNDVKSYGSDPGKRNLTRTCAATDLTTPCNPDSEGVGTSQSWDVGTGWSSNGTLAKLGWPATRTTGQGLNSLGVAMGEATLPYRRITERMIGEICPLGAFTSERMDKIAAEGKRSDDLRQIAALVAADPSCR